MSRRSQQNRAAKSKARAKQRARDKAGRSRNPRPDPLAGDFTAGSWGGSGPSPFGNHSSSAPPRAPSTAEVLEWARAGMVFMMWLEHARQVPERTFWAEAEPILIAWLRQSYGAGWQPTEVIRHVGRHLKSGPAELMKLAVQAERQTRSDPTATDERWEAQWRAADLPRLGERTGWMALWAAVRESWLKEVCRLANLLGSLPTLEQLLPPPAGMQRRGQMMPASKGANPVLVRVRALLAKAESTEHESEALAFTAKAQELITKYALDEAALNGAAGEVDRPSMIRVPIDAPYFDIKALLLHTIAAQSRCRMVLLENVMMATVVGFAADVEATEMLFTSLLVQSQHAIAQAGASAPPGSQTRSQSFRAAFLRGFTNRIEQRLAAVNEQVLDDAKAGAAKLLPVLRARDVRIDEFMESEFPNTIERAVRGSYDHTGYRRGQEAGVAAALISGALEDSHE